MFEHEEHRRVGDAAGGVESGGRLRRLPQAARIGLTAALLLVAGAVLLQACGASPPDPAADVLPGAAGASSAAPASLRDSRPPAPGSTGTAAATVNVHVAGDVERPGL